MPIAIPPGMDANKLIGEIEALEDQVRVATGQARRLLLARINALDAKLRNLA